jgi:hypothetical protein
VTVQVRAQDYGIMNNGVIVSIATISNLVEEPEGNTH